MAAVFEPTFLNQESQELALWPEDVASEQAARTLFRRLDRDEVGYVSESEVLPLWPMLSQHLESASRAALASKLEHRVEPIGREEWMSLMGALREIVGSRRFKSSVRKAESALAEKRAQASQPQKRTYAPYASIAVPVPGAVETTPRSTLRAGTVLFPQQSHAAGNGIPFVKPMHGYAQVAQSTEPKEERLVVSQSAPPAFHEEPQAISKSAPPESNEEEPLVVSKSAPPECQEEPLVASKSAPPECQDSEPLAVSELAPPAGQDEVPLAVSKSAPPESSVEELAAASKSALAEDLADEPSFISRRSTPRTPESVDDPEWVEAARIVDEVSDQAAELGKAMRRAVKKDEKKALLAQKRALESREDYIAALRYLEEPSAGPPPPPAILSKAVDAEPLVLSKSAPPMCPEEEFVAASKGALPEFPGAQPPSEVESAWPQGSMMALRQEAAERIQKACSSGALNGALAQVRAMRDADAQLASNEASAPPRLAAPAPRVPALALMVVPDEALAKQRPPPMSPFNDTEGAEDPEAYRLRVAAASSLVEESVEEGLDHVEMLAAEQQGTEEGSELARVRAQAARIIFGSSDGFQDSRLASALSQTRAERVELEGEDEEVEGLREEAKNAFLSASLTGDLAGTLLGLEREEADGEEVEGLREEAKNAFLSASITSDLAGMLLGLETEEADEEEQVDKLREEAKTAFVSASMTGDLAGLLLGLEADADDGDDVLEKLREEAAKSLMSASMDGTLETALQQHAGDAGQEDEEEALAEIEDLRAQAMESLLSGMLNGNLASALATTKVQTDSRLEEAPDEVEDLRAQAMKSMLSGMRNGNLASALAATKVRTVSRPEEASDEVEVEDLRAQAMQSLLSGMRNGNLASALATTKGADAAGAGGKVASDKDLEALRADTRQAFLAACLDGRLESMLQRAKVEARAGDAAALESEEEAEALSREAADSLLASTLDGRLEEAFRQVTEKALNHEKSTLSMVEEDEGDDEEVELLREAAMLSLLTAAENGSLEAVLADQSMLSMESDNAEDAGPPPPAPAPPAALPEARGAKEEEAEVAAKSSPPPAEESEEPPEAPPVPPVSAPAASTPAEAKDEEGQAKSAPPAAPAPAEDDQVGNDGDEEVGKLVVYAGRIVFQKAKSERSSPPARASFKRQTTTTLPSLSSPSVVLVGGNEESQTPKLVLWQPDQYQAGTSPGRQGTEEGPPPLTSLNGGPGEGREEEGGGQKSAPPPPPMGEGRCTEEEAAPEAPKSGPPLLEVEQQKNLPLVQFQQKPADMELQQHLQQQQERLRVEALQHKRKEDEEHQKNKDLQQQLLRQQDELNKERENHRQEQEKLKREQQWQEEQRLLLQKQMDKVQEEKAKFLEEQAKAEQRKATHRQGSLAAPQATDQGPRPSPQQWQTLPTLEASGSRGSLGVAQRSPPSSGSGALASSAPVGGTPPALSLPPLASSAARTLPPARLGRVESAPVLSARSNTRTSSKTPQDHVVSLQRDLQAERDMHLQTSEELKDVSRKLRIASAKLRKPDPPPRPAKKFGVASAAPYALEQALPPEIPKPKNNKAFFLPALRSMPQSPPKEDRLAAEAEAAAARLASCAQGPGLTRKSKSLSRIDAISKLDSQGMNTWHVRRAEKVARLQDMQAFGGSMWGSFFDWQEESIGVD